MAAALALLVSTRLGMGWSPGIWRSRIRMIRRRVRTRCACCYSTGARVSSTVTGWTRRRPPSPRCGTWRGGVRTIARSPRSSSMNSREFARLRAKHDVRLCSSGTKRLRRPRLGDLDLYYEVAAVGSAAADAVARSCDGAISTEWTQERIAAAPGQSRPQPVPVHLEEVTPPDAAVASRRPRG